jgi:surface antigen
MEHALLAFSLLSAPIDTTRFNNPLIEPEPIAVVTETIKEPTVEEKIASNFYKCDEATQWIWASDATCHDKQVVGQISRENTSKPIKNGSSGLNGYVLNSCTGWVATHRYVPSGWGNATGWKQGALNAGWTVSSVPVAGAIGWVYGHVVFVESVNNDDTVTISERNYDYNGSIRTITVPTSKYTYLY